MHHVITFAYCDQINDTLAHAIKDTHFIQMALATLTSNRKKLTRKTTIEHYVWTDAMEAQVVSKLMTTGSASVILAKMPNNVTCLLRLCSQPQLRSSVGFSEQ